MAITTVSNSAIGALSALRMAQGAFGTSQDDFLLVSTGTVAINGTTPQTVANANVTANSIILFTLKTVGGTVGAQPAIQTITPGTGFTVQGTASDTSTYNYIIFG